MSPVKRLKRSKTSSKPVTLLQVGTKLLVLLVPVALLIIAGSLLLRSFSQRSDHTAVEFSLTVNPSLGPAEAVLLGAYIGANQDALNTPVSDDTTAVTFVVNPGESASQIAENLVALGLIGNATLFRNYLRYYGLDRQIEVGSYQIAPDMTIPQIAITLTHGTPPEITIRATEGWRREQMADWIDRQPDVPFSGAEFLAATGTGASLPPGSSLANVLPAGNTFEGFLFPDTYRIAIDATAADLVVKMLDNFETQVPLQMQDDANAKGLTLYQAVILASIVEREAAVAEERPIIASVYLNRLAAGMKLEADPTVQYAMGFQAGSGQWWNLNLTPDDYRSVDSPYNTYLYAGLPPGPIDSPGLASIVAVIYPADTPYFFFRAACDGSGRHNFAVTYEEHLKNACP